MDLKKDQDLNQNKDELNSKQNQTIPVIEESISIDKVKEATTEIIINKDVEQVEELLEIPIQEEKISIEHIPIGKVIEQYPVVREVDGKTIIPVVKEKLVVTKQLILEEEIHITRNTTEHIEKVKETLKKDVVNIQKKNFNY